MLKKTKQIFLSFLVVVLVFLPFSYTDANTNSTEDMKDVIERLLKQVEDLQRQLAELHDINRRTQTELREVVRETLRQDMSNDQVLRLQELLATDPTIYPEGLTTGYFGQMTSSALKRLQARHNLPTTGEVDEVTREIINEYFRQRDGQVPPGLLRAPGIREVVERGVCDRGRGNRPFCPQEYTDNEKREKEEDKKSDGTVKEDEEDEEVKVDDHEVTDEEISKEDAERAIAGAEAGHQYMQNTVRNVARPIDISVSRNYAIRSQDELRSAQRAYRNGFYEDAYNTANKSRYLAKKAVDYIPERAKERFSVRDAIDDFNKNEREYHEKNYKTAGFVYTCGLEEFKDVVGSRIADRDEIRERWENHHGMKVDNRSVRFINPDDMITLDLVPSRLNIFFDEDGVVDRIDCG